MKQNRIQIDGVWYVREDKSSLIAQNEIDEISVIEFKGVVYETSRYTFEANVLGKNRNNGEELQFYNDDCSIKFTDKTSGDEREDYWDNDDWMLQVAKGHQEALDELKEDLDELGIRQFIWICNDLIEKGYLKSE